MILTAPYATGNMAMVLITVVHLIPALLLGLLLWGRPAGQTASLMQGTHVTHVAATIGGWLAPRPGVSSGRPSTRVRLWRPLHYG